MQCFVVSSHCIVGFNHNLTDEVIAVRIQDIHDYSNRAKWRIRAPCKACSKMNGHFPLYPKET